MSKPVKNLIVESYRRRFGEEPGAVLIDIRGLDANTNNAMRAGLAEKGIRLTMVKNSLARKAVEATPLEPLEPMIEGSIAFAYGGESVVDGARALIDYAKETPEIEFRGALLEGQLFGPDQIEALSKYPTRDEAIADVLTLVVSPARNLAGQITSGGSNVAALVKRIEEKREAGEAIGASA